MTGQKEFVKMCCIWPIYSDIGRPRNALTDAPVVRIWLEPLTNPKPHGEILTAICNDARNRRTLLGAKYWDPSYELYAWNNAKQTQHVVMNNKMR